MKLVACVLSASLLLGSAVLAQTGRSDAGAAACKEHPVTPKLAGATLEDCRYRLYDAYEFPVGAPAGAARDGGEGSSDAGAAGSVATERVAGRLHLTEYTLPRRVAIEALGQYRKALEKQKFEVVHEAAQTPFLHTVTLRRRSAPEVWIQIAAETFNEGEFSESRLAVVEKAKLPSRLSPPSAQPPKGVTDAADCRDLPQIGRISGARISECLFRRDEPSNVVARQLGAGSEVVRGEMASVVYEESPLTSVVEVAETYEAALTKAGWEILESADGGTQRLILAKKSEGEDTTFLIVTAESVNDDRWVRTAVSTFVPRAAP